MGSVRPFQSDPKRMAIRLAEDVCRTYGIDHRPVPIAVPIERIAQGEGAFVVDEFLPFSDGLLTKTEQGYTISVKVGTPENRRRFTIAHELGHLLINRHYRSAGVSPMSRATEELFCNWFAGHLLIPSDVVRIFHSWDEMSIQRADYWAKYLAVSVQAIMWRILEELPGKGGLLGFRVDESTKNGHDFEIRVAKEPVFPKIPPKKRPRIDIGMLVPETSSLYQVASDARKWTSQDGDSPERLYGNVDLGFANIEGRHSVLTKKIGALLWCVLIPVSIEDIVTPFDRVSFLI